MTAPGRCRRRPDDGRLRQYGRRADHPAPSRRTARPHDRPVPRSARRTGARGSRRRRSSGGRAGGRPARPAAHRAGRHPRPGPAATPDARPTADTAGGTGRLGRTASARAAPMPPGAARTDRPPTRAESALDLGLDQSRTDRIACTGDRPTPRRPRQRAEAEPTRDAARAGPGVTCPPRSVSACCWRHRARLAVPVAAGVRRGARGRRGDRRLGDGPRGRRRPTASAAADGGDAGAPGVPARR